MKTPPVPGNTGSGVWPVVTLGVLAAGWLTFLLTTGYTARSVERWGPAPDVVDALGRDAYISRHTLPYYSVVLLLDVLALGSLAVRSRPGWPKALKVLVTVLLVPTVLLHGLVWLVTWVMV